MREIRDDGRERRGEDKHRERRGRERQRDIDMEGGERRREGGR